VQQACLNDLTTLAKHYHRHLYTLSGHQMRDYLLETHRLADGSSIKLAEGTTIRTFADTRKRDFDRLARQVDFPVGESKGEFIVTTPCGQVKTLGMWFRMDMIDGTAVDTEEQVQPLAGPSWKVEAGDSSQRTRGVMAKPGPS
jgi:ferric-dicitrate binding protein FerR (iron transport regulator)